MPFISGIRFLSRGQTQWAVHPHDHDPELYRIAPDGSLQPTYIEVGLSEGGSNSSSSVAAGDAFGSTLAVLAVGASTAAAAGSSAGVGTASGYSYGVRLDASTPAMVFDNFSGGDGTITTAAFTAPAGALLVCVTEWNAQAATTNGITVIDSGGLTWTLRSFADFDKYGNTGGGAAIYTAIAGSATSRTVTVTAAGTQAASVLAINTKVFVLIGYDPIVPFGGVGSGYTTVSTIPAFTSQVAGSWLIFSGCDWNGTGTVTSSDLTNKDTFTPTGGSVYDAISGTKLLGAAGAQTVQCSFVGGTGMWAALEIRPQLSALAAGTAAGGSSAYSLQPRAAGSYPVGNIIVSELGGTKQAIIGTGVVSDVSPVNIVTGAGISYGRATARAGLQPFWINPSPGRLPIFSAAVSNTLSGTADTRIVYIGDASTKGSFSSSFNNSFPYVLSGLLTAAGVPSQCESRIGPFAHGYDPITGLVPDTAVTAGSGWTQSGPDSAGGSIWQNNTTTANLDFAVPIAINAFDVIYFGGAASVFTVLVDGATVDTVTVASDGVFRKKSYTTASATHTISIVRVSGTVFITGWFVQQATKKVIGYNMGCNTVDSSDWAGLGGMQGGLATIAMAQPHLVVIQIGVGDSQHSTAGATFNSNMQTLINAIIAMGSDVIINTSAPSALANQHDQDVIADQVPILAATNNLMGIDMNARWGGSFNYALNTLAFFGSGQGTSPFCPNDAGYADEAAAMSTLLQYAMAQPRGLAAGISTATGVLAATGRMAGTAAGVANALGTNAITAIGAAAGVGSATGRPAYSTGSSSLRVVKQYIINGIAVNAA